MKLKKLKLKLKNLIFPFKESKGFFNITFLVLGLITFFVFSIFPLLSLVQKNSEIILKTDNYFDYIYNLKKIISKEISHYETKQDFIQGTSAFLNTATWITSVDLSMGTGDLLLTIDEIPYFIELDGYNSIYFSNPLFVNYEEISNYINTVVWRPISTINNTSWGEYIEFKSDTKGENSLISISNVSNNLKSIFVEKQVFGKESFSVNEFLNLNTSSFLTGSLFYSSNSETYNPCVFKENCKVSIKVLNYDAIKNKVSFSVKIKKLDSSSIKKEFILNL